MIAEVMRGQPGASRHPWCFSGISSELSSVLSSCSTNRLPTSKVRKTTLQQPSQKNSLPIPLQQGFPVMLQRKRGSVTQCSRNDLPGFVVSVVDVFWNGCFVFMQGWSNSPTKHCDVKPLPYGLNDQVWQKTCMFWWRKWTGSMENRHVLAQTSRHVVAPKRACNLSPMMRSSQRSYMPGARLWPLTWPCISPFLFHYIYPLVNQHKYGKSPLLMGKSTISMTIFNSYVSLPGGTGWLIKISTWIIFIPNMMGSIIPELIIKQQRFWTLLKWDWFNDK